MTDNLEKVLGALRANAEGEAEINGKEYWTVYLDNASYDSGVEGKAFAGTLSQLEQRGLYLSDDQDKYFGYVLKS